MRALACPFAVAFLLCACSSASLGTSSSGSASSAAACSDSSPLAGVPYDASKSRFAFGSTPVAEDAGSLVRWVGADGVVAIFSDGSEMGVMNASAPESGLPDWSTDASKLAAHASDYWVSMGVAPCQIASTGVDGSASGGGPTDGGSTSTTKGPSTIVLGRGIDGIRVVESMAAARFDVNDETTSEAFYWPEIPADVVTAAIAFQTQLSDPAALAAYKAKLPAEAQGAGAVVIHHSHAGATPPFQAAAVYEVLQTSTQFAGELLDFDPDGNPVLNAW